MGMLRLLVVLLTLAFGQAFANGTDKVVAVVNDQIITYSMMESRFDLLAREAGQKIENEQQKRALMARTLASLIDQELQRQYAQRIRMDVVDAEVKQTIAMAEKNRGWEAGRVASDAKGMETASRERWMAETLWQKMIATVVKNRVNVSNVEVDQILQDMLKNRHVVEREISQIFMAVDDNAQEAKVRERMNQVMERLKKGEDFAQLARAFSDDKSGMNGGNMGWFGNGELNPQLEDALDKMTPGGTSELIRTPLGWHIIRLDNVRTTKPIRTEAYTEHHYWMIAAPLGDKKAEDLSAKLQDTVGDLDNESLLAAKLADGGFMAEWPNSKDLGWMATEDLSAQLASAAKELESAGDWSKPTLVDGQLMTLTVTGSRQVLPKELNVYRDRVRGNLMNNRLELEVRRFMRELRQRAFVDVRF